jgi:hypothetical protein
MAMSKERDIPIDPPSSCDHPIGSLADLLRRFAPRTSIPEKQPAGHSLLDLLRRQSFILAIVPFEQIGIDRCIVDKPCQLEGFPCPSQRTDEHKRKSLLGEDRLKPLGKMPPIIGQRDVRPARMLAAETPGRLPMSDRKDLHLALLPLSK